MRRNTSAVTKSVDPLFVSFGMEQGSIAGLVSAVLIVVLSKAVWVVVLGNEKSLFPYEQPASFSILLAFFMAWLGSVTDTSIRAAEEKEAFEDHTASQ